MDNGFSASDAVLTSAMSGGGFGGRGGQWGGGYGSPFADAGSNAVRINRNSDVAREVGRSTQFQLDNAQEERRNTNICNRISDMEFRLADRDRDITKDITDARFESKDCCCETQKEILRLDSDNKLQFASLSKQQAIDNGAVQARLAAIDAKIDANKEIGELNAKLTALQTQVACGCVTGCSTPCPS